MIAMIAATVIHVPLCYIFVHVVDLGVEGIVFATITKDCVLLLTILIYMRCSKRISPHMRMVDREIFRGWCEYLKISLPSTAMLCAEWYAF